jgi:ubiquinone/menaquinone biosynthesis C-methylase UbiE
MSDAKYVFGKDSASEEKRLVALEQAFDALSQNALIDVGVRPGWRCWEVGAGRGSIARWLCEAVGEEGHVVATDLHGRWLGAPAEDITFRCHDVVRDPAPGGGFDLVHARFLLEHLAHPRAVMVRLADALRPGGVLLLEDSAGLDSEVTPATPLFRQFVPKWERAAQAVGWDAAYGKKLMSDLQISGLEDLRGRQYRQLAPGGEGWAHVSKGIERLNVELREQGVTAEDLEAVLRRLADPECLITGPPVVIAWGRKAGG